MVKTQPAKTGQQWKAIDGITRDKLARTCEEWTGRGWTVNGIFGPLHDGWMIVLSRMLTL